MTAEFSRRGLIGMGLGAALLPAISKAQTAKENGGVGFAIVGLGKLSLGQLIPAFRNTKTARLAGLVSGHPDKAQGIAQDHQLASSAVYTYADFDRIASNPNIDVVYIVLPNFMIALPKLLAAHWSTHCGHLRLMGRCDELAGGLR